MQTTRQKVVCSMTADIPGDGDYFFGETLEIVLSGGYVIETKEDEKHLITAVKNFVQELWGEDVYINLFDENGNEVWVR